MSSFQSNTLTRIPSVVKLADKLTTELPLLEHHVVVTVEKVRVLLLGRIIRFILKVSIGNNLEELHPLCPLTLVNVLNAVELNIGDPDALFVVLEDEIVAVLLEVLVSEMLIEPKLLKYECHPDKVLHFVDVKDLLYVEGDVDVQLVLVGRSGDEELVVPHRRYHHPALLLVRPVPAVGPPVTPISQAGESAAGGERNRYHYHYQ